jgi:Protein of unknown function (DUF3887)
MQTLLSARTTVTLLLSAMMFVGCNPTAKIDEGAVDAQQKATAQAFALKLCGACNTGKFEALGPEAIPAMQDGLTPEKQKTTCDSTRQTFGDFQSVDYVETWKTQGLFVYRFRAHYGKSTTTPEVRVVLDGDSKLAGYWLKPWADALK